MPLVSLYYMRRFADWMQSAIAMDGKLTYSMATKQGAVASKAKLDAVESANAAARRSGPCEITRNSASVVVFNRHPTGLGLDVRGDASFDKMEDAVLLPS